MKSFAVGPKKGSTISIDRVGLLGDGQTPPTPTYIINALSVYGQEKHLVVRDIDVYNTSDALLPDEINCDVACLVYDTSDPKSFQFIAKIYVVSERESVEILLSYVETENVLCDLQKYFSDSGIPCLLVGTKADMEPAVQNYFLQPDVFCSKYNLPALQFYSADRPQPISRDIFIKLATMASYP